MIRDVAGPLCSQGTWNLLEKLLMLLGETFIYAIFYSGFEPDYCTDG